MTSDTSKQHYDTPVDTADAPGSFSSLPLDVISTHILRSDFLPEPRDLGRLRAVSHWMRNAVDATGRKIKKLSDTDAANLGHLSLLKDRHTRGVLKSKRYLCEAAARSGQLEELKAFRAKNFPWDEWTCAGAAEGGHLEVLKWARANGCPWDKWTCAYAAEAGHLEVLKWARENGCPWDEKTCAKAAGGGHLEVLKWARENGCPWDMDTCSGAAFHGHFEVLKWARENGCPWDKWTCERAAAMGYVES